MYSRASSPSNIVPPARVGYCNIPRQITRGNRQRGTSQAAHALLPISVRLDKGHFSERLRVNYPREVLLVPKLSLEPCWAINFDAYFLAAEIYKHAQVIRTK